MANIRVDSSRVIETSRAVAGDAETLRAELSGLAREWDAVVSGWSGAAASSYAALWEEWHDGAVKLIDALTESSSLLQQAAARYDEQEAAAARAMHSVPAGIEA